LIFFIILDRLIYRFVVKHKKIFIHTQNFSCWIGPYHFYENFMLVSSFLCFFHTSKMFFTELVTFFINFGLFKQENRKIFDCKIFYSKIFIYWKTYYYDTEKLTFAQTKNDVQKCYIHQKTLIFISLDLNLSIFVINFIKYDTFLERVFHFLWYFLVLIWKHNHTIV
jgi:hypothetical protein